MNLSPLPIQKFFDNNGRPAAGYKLFTYEAGTNNKIATYVDSSGVTPNTNPVVLDFRGECRLWIDPQQAYKFVLSPRNDTDPPTDPIWTVDNITAGPAQQDNAAVDTGSVNNIELSIPQISSPVAFTRIVFKAANTNTGPVTITINGGTAKNLTWQNIGAFAGGEIQANGIYEAIYDGAQWQLQGPTLQPPQMRTAAEIAVNVTPLNYAYFPPDPRRYGGSPSSDPDANDSAFEDAVDVAYEMGGAVIPVASGIWRVNQTIVLKHGVFIIGNGPNTYYAVPATTIRPTSSFTGSEVVRCDSADSENAPICSGLGLSNIAIDMLDISALGKIAIVLRSVSNTRPFTNVTVLNLDHGRAILIEKSAALGALPNDGLVFSSFYTYGNIIDPGSTAPRLEISHANETSFVDCKFQHRVTTVVAGSYAVYVGDNVLGLTFSECAFAGAETGAFIGNTDSAASAEHVRFLNCIFETYRFGVFVRGAFSSSDPNLYSKRIWVEEGNRFLTAQGVDPRNVVLNKAIDCYVRLDEAIGGGTGTPLLAEATTDSSACYIYAPPTQVLNNGTNNIVVGRNGDAWEFSRIYAEALIAASLENSWTQFSPSNRSATGYWKDRMGVVHVQGHITGGTVGGPRAFQMPVGYRPAKNQNFAVPSNDAFGLIRISDAGDVFVEVGNNAWVALDGINFRNGD